MLLIGVSDCLGKEVHPMDFCSCAVMAKPPVNVPKTVPVTVVPANVTPSARILMGEPISSNDLQYLAVLYIESLEECDFSKSLWST